MRKKLLSNLFVLLALVPFAVSGQSTLRTPYSQRGVGELQPNVFASQQAMGGVAVGMRMPNLINMANPASLTAQDTNSFVFDVGVIYKASQYEMNGQTANHFTSNINHIAASFPILAHRWFSSISLLPYSKMGYTYDRKTNYVPYTPENKTYEGTGGLTRFNWSNGFILSKNVSIGVSASYLFGNLTKTNTINYPFESNGLTNTVKKASKVGGFYFNYGAQYYTKNEDDNFVIGATFQNQWKVKADYTEEYFKTYNVVNYTVLDQYNRPTSYTIEDTLYKSKKKSNILLPTSYALGASWNHKNIWIVGIDANFENWSQSKIMDEDPNLKDKMSINVGAQFTPNPRSYTSYFSRVHYRVGGYYNQSELELRGQRINDYGVSAGLGLPFFGTASTFNVNYQYGMKGTTSNGLLSERYSYISFGFSFYDIWFIKRRLS